MATQGVPSSAQPPAAVGSNSPQTPQKQSHQQTPIGVASNTQSTLSPTAQATTEQKATRSFFNPMRYIKGSEYPVEVPKIQPQPVATTNTPASNSNTNNSPNVVTPVPTTPGDASPVATPPVAPAVVKTEEPKKTEEKSVEPKIGMMEQVKGLGAFVTAPLAKVVGYHYVLVDGKLILNKNETTKPADVKTDK